MKITEIKELLMHEPNETTLEELKLDTRAGVQKLLASYYKKIAAAEEEKIRFSKMLESEHKYWDNGIKYVAGVDEAGRGPLAGPLVVASVILPQDIFISGLNDSKQLSASKRDKLYGEVCAKAISISVNIVGTYDIDRLNIYEATKESMVKVLENLEPYPEAALIDAMPISLDNVKVESLIHGDARSATIAAASIIAKVTRDRIMIDLDKEYPQYGFAGHKGYGSQSHMDAIRQYGATKWHRRSYEPVKSMHIMENGVDENIVIKLKTNNNINRDI